MPSDTRVTRPNFVLSRHERYTVTGNQWHTHAFSHAHDDGDGEHDHGSVLLTEELAEHLADVLEQVARTRVVEPELAETATALARELR